MSTTLAPVAAPTTAATTPSPAVPAGVPPRHTLYAFADALAAIEREIDARFDEIADAGGALPDDLAARLEAVGASFDEKAERVELMRRAFERLADEAGAEIKRLQGIQRSRRTAAEGLGAYLTAQLAAADRAVKTARVDLRVQRAGVPAMTYAETLAGRFTADDLLDHAVHAALFAPVDEIPAVPAGFVLSREAAKALWLARFREAFDLAPTIVPGATEAERLRYANDYATAGMPDGVAGTVRASLRSK